ncbi:type I DNA topoisomerase [Rhodanobacter sp. 115]|uniref:type I DNA topoisomerase n=1 Tax=Rhodanobacter sp. FW021-MT20 TaxID=1162282 RepID=UPI0034E3F13A
MTTLVIVESPGKLKKIRSILGNGYRVEASVGHVRDLPRNDLGVELTTFKPLYEKTVRGKEVLQKLAAAASSCDRVLLATDPDREGEAIAWHLADALKIPQAKRITFQAIEAGPVKAALASPRAIDMQLVHAQEARRVLDRLVGYMVSPALSDKIGRKMSAGRVQSPAVLLVVLREREIRDFKPTIHFGAVLTFAGEWTAQWETKPHLAKDESYFLDGEFAKQVAAVREVRVTAFKDSQSKAAPKPPFTTTTMQKAAQAALKLKPKATMDLAQKLYEQGAITYHRTDTPNLSTDGYKALVAYAATAGIPLVDKQRTWKAKESAQEAHEACRPTHFEEREAGETPEQKALYRLIWARAVACQMPDAVYAVRTAQLTATRLTGPTGQPVTFLARGKTLTSPGWKAVYEEAKEPAGDGKANTAEGDDVPDDNPVPALQVGGAATAVKGKVERLSTKAPKRYNQTSLVEEMERLGIGRPSTYAAILQNVFDRGYITEDKKDFLHACPDGEALVDALVGKCRFIELDYTRALEDHLDAIAQGKSRYLSVVGDAHQQLAGELVTLGQGAAPAHPCPSCGKPMRRRAGKKTGHFWGCSGYPECTTTLPDDDGKPGAPRPASEVAVPKAAPAAGEHHCNDCGKPLQHRQGKSDKGAYDFWGCTGYPKCRTTYRTGPDGLPVR